MTCDEFIELRMKMQKRLDERITKEQERLLELKAQLEATLEESLIVDEAFATFSEEDQKIIALRLMKLKEI